MEKTQEGCYGWKKGVFEVHGLYITLEWSLEVVLGEWGLVRVGGEGGFSKRGHDF